MPIVKTMSQSGSSGNTRNKTSKVSGASGNTSNKTSKVPGSNDSTRNNATAVLNTSDYILLSIIGFLRSINTEANAVPSSNIAESISLYQDLINAPGQAVNASTTAKKPDKRRTVERKLQTLLDIQNIQDENECNPYNGPSNMLRCLLGGKIKVIHPGTKGTLSKYYFEPILDDAVMQMLNGMIISNQFFSNEEKRFLLYRLSLLNMMNKESDEISEGGPWGLYSDSEEEEQKDPKLPGNADIFLKNVITLYQAMVCNRQIQMTYGIYDIDTKTGKITFHNRVYQDGPEKGKSKTYCLNPYALTWNDGHYYLIASYDIDHLPENFEDPGTPVRFRVDRIITVDYIPIEASDECRHPADQSGKPADKSGKSAGKAHKTTGRSKEPVRYKERQPATGRIKTLFTSDAAFNEAEFKRQYPNMGISWKEKKLLECRIRCTESSLQVLIDTFGTDIEIKPDPKGPNPAAKAAWDHTPAIIATIHDVQFENMRDFCLRNITCLTPSSPPKLVNAVRDQVENILKNLPTI